MTGPSDLTISAVMPAYAAETLLDTVLPPLLALRDRGEIGEVIVVDDCSPDRTAETAREMGARVLIPPANGGPGAARNLAAAVATGEILWFVDSDVVARPDGAGHLRAAFADPEVAAVFGSYDTEPAGRPWFSRYKNLMHHFYHQGARRDARTFWAGYGAVRRDVFRDVGGFDVETYRVPSIEDIELGYRISGAGHRIRLIPEMQCKHLKVWTVANSVQTDIFKRALPWARLMLGREGVTDDLNTGWGERIRALIAWVLALSLLALPVQPGLWPAAPLLAATAVFANLGLARFFLRHGGPVFAAAALAYHQVYYIYASATFAWCVFEARILGRRGAVPVGARAAPDRT